MKSILTALIILTVASCQSVQVEPTKPTQPQEPVKVEQPAPVKKIYASGKWDSDFDKMISAEVLKTDLVNLKSERVNFCPNWDKLSKEDRAQEFANLFHAIAFFESSFELNNRYVEKEMSTDPVTGLQVVSEGLFQLSYQDSQNYKGCAEIDFSKDKDKKVNDLTKTIFQPDIQIRCSIYIANRIMTKRSENIFCGKKYCGLARYWAVIFSRENEIKAKIKSYKTKCGL